jgi:hypothetical protein
MLVHTYATSCIRTSMRRHCLSRPTWRSLPVAECKCFLPCARYASIRTSSEPTLFGESVHYGIHLLGYLGRCNLPIGLSSWEDQVRNCAVAFGDPKRYVGQQQLWPSPL